jgi:hypothetical protein
MIGVACPLSAHRKRIMPVRRFGRNNPATLTPVIGAQLRYDTASKIVPEPLS